jgi:hypothetical protein
VNYVTRRVDPLFVPAPNDGVLALAFNAGKLYAGGRFTTIGGAAINGVARMDPATGAVDAGWAPRPGGGNPEVDALAPVGADMLVGGAFATIGGQSRAALARISGATGAVVPSFDPAIANANGNASVLALAVAENAVYAGGNFTSVHGVASPSLAKLDATTGAAVPGFTAPALNGSVNALLVDGNTLFAGGRFNAGAPSLQGIARIEASSGIANTSFGSVGDVTDSPSVFALAETPGRFWLAGGFDTFAGQKRSAIASFGTLVPQIIKVYEFFAPTLNHYFRTANAEEANALIANPALGFNATGNDFGAWSRAAYPEDGTPVYRFYGSVTPGPNSHFYTADPAEYAALRALEFVLPNAVPRWNFEEIAFAINLPVAPGICPPGAPVKVYRAYNNRAAQGDSNHRYTSDLNAFNQMLAQGWIGEGVVMCALN